MVEIKVKSIVACKQAYQADAAVPFQISLTNGRARTASHTKSTINHTPATLHYYLCRHFIALHFVWKCILDASYRKCSWHCPDLYWTFMHCILWSFPQNLVMNAQTKLVLKHWPSKWLKCKVLRTYRNSKWAKHTDRQDMSTIFVIFRGCFWVQN